MRYISTLFVILLVAAPAGAKSQTSLFVKRNPPQNATQRKPLPSTVSLKYNFRKPKERDGLLAERPSVTLSKDKSIKPDVKPTRFVDPPPRFWTDQGESWRSSSPTTES